jgi:hypothetical protein
VSEWCLSLLPKNFDVFPADFGADGALPPGDFAPSQVDFEAKFVSVGDVQQRDAIYQGWQRHREELLLAGLSPDSRQLLDGSFTTSKPCPGDIDLAVEVAVADSSRLTVTKHQLIFDLLGGPKMKADYCCDAYPIVVLPATDPDYQMVTVRAIEYWTKWFGSTRSKTQKGRVWTKTGGFYE